MTRDMYAYAWATIAAGVAGSPLRSRTASQVAKETDEIMAEFEQRMDQKFPPPPEHWRDREPKVSPRDTLNTI